MASRVGGKIVPGGSSQQQFTDLSQEGVQLGDAVDGGRLWPKKTDAYVAGSNRDGGKFESESRLRSSNGRHVSFKDVATTLRTRSPRRRLEFWVKCVSCILSLVWNVASPVKSYMLSFYGLPGDDLVFSHNLNWTMEVDYQYAKALYDKSGIKYTAAEDKPIRFINMYLDFVMFNRAGKWAHYLDDFQQDPYVGLFCRTSLTPKADKIKIKMDNYCTTNGYYAGNNFLEQSTCRVSEVSEAIMCLKGINVLTLMNYEWKSTYDPNNTYVQQGARLYQDTVFPDLDACLARRALLVAQLGRDDALHRIVQELATNYSLDPTGFGGKKGLYEEFRYYEGFTDLSGRPSGVRYSKMSGSLPERTQPIEPDLNALVLGRERLWWIVGLAPQAFRDAVVDFSYYAPYMFLGMHIKNKADSGRFVERYAIEKAGTIGICQNWNLVPAIHRPAYPDPVYLDTAPETSVLTSYGAKYFVPRVIRENAVTDKDELIKISSRLSTICLTRDGCMDACKPARAAGWVATFDRSGACRDREVSQSVVNRQGHVDWRCFGEGTGTDTLSIKVLEPVKLPNGSTFEYTEIRNTANPAAIVACVLGGRIPQQGDEPYPNVFFDLIKNGPNTIITTTFSRGTEKVLVNVYALVSLVGCTVFAMWVLQNMKRLIHTLQRVKARAACDSLALTQLIDSAFTVNLSTVAHGRNIQLSKVILWLNFVTWYIGASDSNCTWWVNGVDLWTPGFQLQPSDSPYYRCKPGYFVEFLDSFIGVVRVISISYNFYSLTCQHLILRGATRYVLPFLSPILFFGLLPTIIASLTITGINHLRLEFGVLANFHNQLFLVLLWVGYLFGYHWLLQNQTLGNVLVGILVRFRLCGKQHVTPGSVAESIIGPYYLTMPGYTREEAVEWIPISVALESATFNVNNLDFTTRLYSPTNPVKGVHARAPIEIPDWVLEHDEYLIA